MRKHSFTLAGQSKLLGKKVCVLLLYSGMSEVVVFPYFNYNERTFCLLFITLKGLIVGLS